MSGFRGIAKNGWHPKGKDGGKESWRGDNKGINTAGWVGKGKDSSSEAAHHHQSAPLSTLKDPASFGPPPKHVKYHGTAAASPSSSLTPADSGGFGDPPQGSARQRLQEAQEAQAREEEATRLSPGPYRANTTGLNTAHLPKPPAFQPSQASSPSTTTAPNSKPRLPPRLPPRQNTHPDANAPAPPPPYSETPQDEIASQGYLNQGALNRLGSAGVSVPGFGIGRNASPPVPPRQNSALTPPPPPRAANANNGSQLNELQSRFSKMTASPAEAPATGTTWAEKQAALKTASNLRNDPSKVTMSDARNAAHTANNFRERHGEQVASGWRTASGLNQKYGITNKVNSFASSSSTPPPQSPTQGAMSKKPPPPPPPKKKDLTTSSGEPPPIPLSSKPKF